MVRKNFQKKSENCLISEMRTIQPIVQSNRGVKSNETEILDKRFSKMLVCLFSGNSRKYYPVHTGPEKFKNAAIINMVSDYCREFA